MKRPKGTKGELPFTYESNIEWATQLLHAGRSEREILDDLASLGISRFEAHGIVQDAAKAINKSQKLIYRSNYTRAQRTKRIFSRGDRASGLVQIGIGALMVIAGFALTLLTQAIASSEGGSGFLVFWGLIVFGAWVGLKGIWTFFFGR
jgi:hypothetical protein